MKLNELFEAAKDEVAIIFGRFNPPHKGHKAAWEMASQSKNWFVGTNQSTVGLKDPLPYEIKVEAMKTIYPEIEGHLMPETSWVTMASKIYERYGDVKLLVLTDEDWVTKTLQQYNGIEGKPHGFYNFSSIEQKPTPRLSSATALRDAVANNDKGAFTKAAGIDADELVAGKPYFDLIAEYMAPYLEKEKAKAAKKKKSEDIEETIRKVKGGYRLYSKDGKKNLGTYPTRAGAVKRERQVQYFKHADESVEEGWKSKMAGAALAAANLLGSPAQAAEEPNKPITIAHVMIDGEVRKYNLGNKFENAKEAEKFITNILNKQGLSGYTLDIKHGYPKEKQTEKKIKAEESVDEGKFRARDIEEKLIPNDKLNDLKSKYLPDWEMLDHRILQAKYVAKDHRHAEDFISYINRLSEEMDHFAEVTQDVGEVTVRTTTFDVKGLTILDFKLALKVDKFADRNEIEQVRMQGNFGMHESSHGRYWCSTDKKWKQRKGPKQKRSS